MEFCGTTSIRKGQWFESKDMTVWIALIVGLLVGVVVGVGLSGRPLRRRRSSGSRSPQATPSSVEHVIDLLRRANGAPAACLVGRSTEPVMSGRADSVEPQLLQRMMELAKLAMEDGREHVTRDEATVVVAVGDHKLGAAVLWEGTDPSADRIADLKAEMRRMLGEFRVDHGPLLIGTSAPREIPVDLPPRLDTLPAIASGLCDRAHIITGRPTAVMARDPETQGASIIAVSTNADRRLIGFSVTPESAVGRASMADGAIVAGTSEELFGKVPANRRLKAEQGTAYPLRDGRDGVGALIIFGPDEELDASLRERIMWLAVDTGPRIAAATAVRAAEDRANRDGLTGLPNRSSLERAMANASVDPCAVLCVNLDHFKGINDKYGPAAGDATLKHLARIFRAAVRPDDVAARIGGEEFVVWLPETTAEAAQVVAERIRREVDGTYWEWAGTEVPLTCSIGVAASPEGGPEMANLMPAADAALHRAKKAGGNRVEAAQGEEK